MKFRYHFRIIVSPSGVRAVCRRFTCVCSALWLCFWFSTIALSADVPQANEKQTAEQLIRRLYENRTQITLAELEWAVEILQFKEHPDLVGRSNKFHAWYDFINDRIRVDLDRKSPQNPKMTGKSRVAYSDNRYLSVDSEERVGREFNGIGPKYLHKKTSIRMFHLSADPRLLGVFPCRFALLKNYVLDDILSIFHTSNNYNVSEVEVDGRLLIMIRFVGYQGADCNITYWLDSAVGNMPTRIVSEAVTDIGLLKNEIQSKWQSFAVKPDPASVIWFPSETVSRRWLDEELQTHEVCTLQHAVFDEQPSEDLFTWDGMNLPDRFVVDRRSGEKKEKIEVVQWNASKQEFEKWKPIIRHDLSVSAPNIASELGAVPGEKTGSGKTRVVLILVNAVIGLILVLYALFKWRSKMKS